MDAVGRGVTRFRVGDRVMGMPWFPREAAAYAEYVVAPSRHFVATPPGLDHVHAGAIPMAALTAWHALIDTAQLQAGDRVVVQGAGGGVGHVAVQIARSRGAYVVGVASHSKHDLLRRLGANELVDYRKIDVREAVDRADVVLDLVGGEVTTASVGLVRRGGLVVVAPGGTPDGATRLANERGVRLTSILVEPDHCALASVADLVTAGKLEIEVTRTLPIAEASTAHETIESGHTQGKLVLTVP